MSDDKGVENAQFRLNTVENTRKSMGRLIRMYLRDEVEREVFRDAIYGFSAYLSAWKLGKDDSIEQRIKILEQQLKASN